MTIAYAVCAHFAGSDWYQILACFDDEDSANEYFKIISKASLSSYLSVKSFKINTQQELEEWEKKQ